MNCNSSFILLQKLNSIPTSKLNISGVTIIFHVMNKHKKVIKTTKARKIKQLFNFIRQVFLELLYSQNACTKIVVLSNC